MHQYERSIIERLADWHVVTIAPKEGYESFAFWNATSKRRQSQTFAAGTGSIFDSGVIM